MEDNKIQQDSKFQQDGKSITSSVGFGEVKNTEETWRFGREGAKMLVGVERNFFSEIDKEQNTYYIRKMPKEVSSLDFQAFSFAAMQILYNQSHQYGNNDTNSGRSRQHIDKNQTAREGKTIYRGDIVATINDMCRLGYGIDSPDYKQRKAMQTLIESLDKEPIVFETINGDILKSYLCKIQEEYTPKNGAKGYHLILSPIFTKDVATNYGVLPQDHTKRLSAAATKLKKKLSPELYRLSRWLGYQDRRKPVPRYIVELLNIMSIKESSYKAQRKRTEKFILDNINILIEAGQVERIETQENPLKKGVLYKIKFYLNKKYGHENEWQIPNMEE